MKRIVFSQVSLAVVAVTLGASAFFLFSGCSNGWMNQWMHDIYTPDNEEPGIYYTVTFDTDGGSAVPAQEVPEGETAERPANPTKQGSGFVNWYDNEDFNEPHYDFNTPVTRDITLYAKWSENFFTVTFNANGGTPEPEPETVGEGGTLGKPADPARNGFAFSGWYADDAFINAWDFEKDAVTRDITLYAKWLRLFTVTFDTDGGSAVDSQEIPEGGTATRPANPTKDDFYFVNWYANENLEEPHYDFDTPVTGDITLYAKWSEDFFTVTFDSSGGSAVDSQNVGEGGMASRPDPDPIKDSFAFDGWYKDNNFTEEWDFDTDTVTEAVTLYAKWLALFTVTFETGGGLPVPQVQDIGEGRKAEEPGAIAKTADHYLYLGTPPGGSPGFTFDGWYREEALTNKWDFAVDTVTGDITLYAKWGGAIDLSAMSGDNDFEKAIAYVKQNAADDAYTLFAGANVDLAPQTLNDPAIDLTIVGTGGERAIQLTETGSLFTIGTGVTLTLDSGITLKGVANTVSLVKVDSGGTLTMIAGSKISGNTATGISVNGGVNNAGTFNMFGGEISGNEAVSSGGPGTNGGGVYNTGNFTMSGGTISGNTAGSGGGVYNSGTFTMSGGTISVNTSGSGGGVNNTGTFTMSGGTIQNNTASSGGGGVYASNGFSGPYVFTICGSAVIKDNTAVGNGGGVFFSTSANTNIFNLGGSAVIQGNTNSGGSKSNVYLGNNNYITLGTGADEPAGGMDVGVQTTRSDGVIVQADATDAVLPYFKADETGKIVALNGTEIRIFAPAVSVDNGSSTTEYPNLKDALDSIKNSTTAGTYTVKVFSAQSLAFYNFVGTQSSTDITLIADSGSVDIQLTGQGSIFSIPTGVTLTLGSGIVLKGSVSSNNAPFISVTGILKMNAGAEITGHNSTNLGAVLIQMDGTFTMSGGKIYNNTGTSGGGVHLSNACTFNMSGGEISNNTTTNGSGGGVYVYDNTSVINLGGSAVINNNKKSDDSASNVYLDLNGAYSMITLGTGADAPAPSMNVGVTAVAAPTATDRQFVLSGATAPIASYFHADEDGKEVARYGDRLYIITPTVTVTPQGGVTSGYQDLEEALNSITTAGTYTVRIKEDQELFPYEFNSTPASTSITLEADSPSQKTVELTDPGSLFTIPADITLTLGNGITLMGISNNIDSLVKVDGGTLKMNAGAKITENTRNGNSGAGVNVESGTFTMSGGEISGNKGSVWGGGVYNTGNFTISGGKITGNSAGIGGGVYNSGTFTMSGGEISGNTITTSGGGGVCNSGTFTMTGGKITGNSAGIGGGVYNMGNFTMSGGEISVNTITSTSDGGGVSHTGGSFTLGGSAVIKDNTAVNPNNVHVISGLYITLGTGTDAPASNMEVYVQTEDANGVIVNAGATDAVVPYFYADEASKEVVLNGDRLLIQDIPTYTVTFDSNGGSNVNPRTGIAGGATTTAPTAPTITFTPLNQEHFRGWFTDNGTFANLYDFGTPVTASITLYADWGYRIGDTGPGGGTIFCRDDTGFTMTDDNSTVHYLEAAPADATGGSGSETIMMWSTKDTFGPFPDVADTETAIGTGRKNTALIIAAETAEYPGDTYIYAALACDNYGNSGKDDWFLPSKDELNALYENKDAAGNMENNSYWSSSHYTNNGAWRQRFSDGNQGDYYRNGTFSVRAVRAF